jgi:hypothetical protein
MTLCEAQGSIGTSATSASAELLVARPVSLAIQGGMVREPVRPAEYRGAGFAEKYDSSTLFFDAIFSSDGSKIILLGPPFNNLADHVAGFVIVARPSGERCNYEIRNMDRHAQMWISVPPGTERISVHSPLGEYEVTPNANQSAFFSDKRVLFTLSKNNRLEWIEDWVRYHRDIHGANAILLYDNKSTEYSEVHLAQRLSQIAGIERVGVVSWPFKYGPLGTVDGLYWDSDYCQAGAFEHARWMYLQAASSVMNNDIDEFVVPMGRRGAFEAAERSWTGYIRYYGSWVTGVLDRTRDATPDAPIRHRDFEYRLKVAPKRRWRLLPDNSRFCNPKWAVVPRRCPPGTQWLQHYIDNWPGGKRSGLWVTTREFYFGHFREISTGWNHLDRSIRPSFDPKHHVYDAQLRSKLDSVRWDV